MQNAHKILKHELLVKYKYKSYIVSQKLYLFKIGRISNFAPAYERQRSSTFASIENKNRFQKFKYCANK